MIFLKIYELYKIFKFFCSILSIQMLKYIYSEGILQWTSKSLRFYPWAIKLQVIYMRIISPMAKIHTIWRLQYLFDMLLNPYGYQFMNSKILFFIINNLEFDFCIEMGYKDFKVKGIKFIVKMFDITLPNILITFN